MNKTVQMVHEARNSVSGFFQEKWDSAIQNAEFYRLIQYSKEQLLKAGKQNRVPYVLDYVTLVMNTLLGDQRDNRTDLVYLPVEANDDVRAELLNAVKDHVLRQNTWIYTESDIFQDGLIEKTGACGYEWSTENNPLGELKIFRIPQAQLMWDLDRREYGLKSDTKWLSRARLYGKDELQKKYPGFKKEIKNMSFQIGDLDDLKLDPSYTKQICDSGLGAVATIEYYERRYKTRFFVRDNGGIQDGYYESRKDAERAIKEMQAQAEGIISQLNNVGRMLPSDMLPKFDVVQNDTPCIYKSEVAMNTAFLEDEEQDVPFFPYDTFHAFWHDGEWWSAMDLFKDAQKFINKMFSQIDHQIAVNSKGLLLIDETVPEAQANQLIEAFSKTGGAFRMKDPKNNVHFIDPKGFDPRLIGAMELAVVNLEKKSGGANLLGQSESSSESGTAIRQRIERGGVSSFPIFDNFDRFKLSVGEKIAWYITNFMTSAQKLRIEGDELNELAKKEFPDWFKPSRMQGVGFLEVNTTKENTINDLKVDIIVDKSRHTVTKNQNILLQLSQLMQSSPLLAETVPPQLLIQILDLPASLKRKMTAESEKLLEMRMRQAEAQAVKPPSLSASLSDITLFQQDPQAQAQFAQKFGVQLNAPVQEQKDDKVGELLLKAEIDRQRQERDIEFKQGKHETQLLSKGIDNIATRNLEREKMKHDEQMKKEANDQRNAEDND